MHHGGRGAVAQVDSVVADDVDSVRGLVGVLVHCRLHLLENLVKLDEVLLCAGIRHRRKIVVLRQRPRTRGCGTAAATTANRPLHAGSRSRHVVTRRRQRSVRHGEHPVERQERLVDLGIRVGLYLASLGASEEVVDHLHLALAVVEATGGVVAEIVVAGTAHGLLVKIQSVVGGWLGGAVVAGVGGLVVESGGISPHLAIVVVVAGGS